MKLISAVSGALVLYLGWRSLEWPLIHDAPIMHYIAWLIGQGAVPYRDIFDMNLPGVYLIHRAVLVVGGRGDLAWRLFDLLWLVLTCAVLARYCRPAGDRWTVLGAGALFALYHVSGGAWRAGQRDFLLCLFLLLGVLGVARSLERGGALLPLLGAGLALGAGVMVKPQSGALWLACIVTAAAVAWRRGRATVEAGVVLVSGLVAPVAVLGWLTWRGGLGAFLTVLTGYVVPLYTHVGRVRVWEGFGWYPYAWRVVGLWAALLVLALLAPTPEAMGARKGLALLGVAYGWFHFQIQGKGWEYHLYPLALFVTALVPFAVAPAVATVSGRAVTGWRRPVALAVVATLALTLGAKGMQAMAMPWIPPKARRVAEIARDLRPLVPPGGTVQVMDVTEGGIHALLNLELRQPTRFIYDFHFFHDTADPRIRALQAEFVTGLETGRPAAIVVLKESWNRPGYDRLGELPGLLPLLDRAYSLAVDGGDYRIYAKRADS